MEFVHYGRRTWIRCTTANERSLVDDDFRLHFQESSGSSRGEEASKEEEAHHQAEEEADQV